MFNISGSGSSGSSGSSGKSVSKKHPKLSDAEIEGLLKGYSLIQPEMWKNISINTHIRYFKKNGTFVRGGFLISHWYNAGGLPCAHVSNNLRKDAAGYKAWPIDFAKVDKIYAKLAGAPALAPAPGTPRESTPRGEVELLKKKLGDIIAHVNKLTLIVNEQKQRIDSLEKRIG